jgi:uncharacterized protein (TIGR02246 family)
MSNTSLAEFESEMWVNLGAANHFAKEGEICMPSETPEAVLESIVDGINTGDLDSVTTLYEPDAVFAVQPGKLTDRLPGIREALSNFVAAKGRLELKVTRVLQGGGLALVTGVWSFVGTAPDGQPLKLAAKSADVLRRQKNGTWRFVIDNPWGTD